MPSFEFHRDLAGAELHIPKTHASSHAPGGTDPLSLGEVVSFDDISDVEITNVGDNHLVYYDEPSGLWKNISSPTFDGSNITNIDGQNIPFSQSGFLATNVNDAIEELQSELGLNSHDGLNDMPSATNTDHDGRYYTETESDAKYSLKLSLAGGTMTGALDMGNQNIINPGTGHDIFTDFVSNEHINHQSVRIIAGTGLTGGGDLTSNRTLHIDTDVIATVNYVDFISQRELYWDRPSGTTTITPLTENDNLDMGSGRISGDNHDSKRYALLMG